MTNSELLKKVHASFLQEWREQIRTGMEVEVYQMIKEWNKERVQRYKGLVIKTAGKHELEKTITVRRKVGPFGVEKVFAIHSPTIQKIDIIKQFKVRRKSIKFIRDLTGKAARLKEIKKDIPKQNNNPQPQKSQKETVEPTQKNVEKQPNTPTIDKKNTPQKETES